MESLVTQTLKIKVSDYIAQFIRAQKIDYVFEVAGGMITHILDSLYLDNYVNIVSVHHEQAAAFAAEAYGRLTGKPGVALATSGPGATNLLTGIASCYFDSSPALFITGQVNVHEQKGHLNIRQLGFQETDIASMAACITKKCYTIKDANEIPAILNQAYQTAIQDRPGPVLIDLPMNLQRVELNLPPPYKINKKNNGSININLTEFFSAIKNAKYPLILAGGGITTSKSKKQFLNFVNATQMPVVTSLQAIDVLPYYHPLRVGFIGSYGNRWANLALGKADLLIVLGSRLDIRQTGADVEHFRKNKIIYQVDCDAYEINNRIKETIPIVCDLNNFFKLAKPYLKTFKFTDKQNWLNEINSLRNQWHDTKELNITSINPNQFIHQLTQLSQSAAGFVVDVGSHQMWAAQSAELDGHQFFMTSAGLGSMGFALPAAIGACFAHERKPVVVIAGDGGFQMNIQELQTVVRNKLPLKIVILNNNILGMIRQFQDSYFESRHQSTHWGYSAPDFEKIAKSYGIDGYTISKPDDILLGIEKLWEHPNESCLLQVIIEAHVNVYPKIAYGRPITEMEPHAFSIEMEAT